MTYIAAAGALMTRPAGTTEQDLVSELAKTLVEMRRRAQLSRRQLEEVSDVSEETIKGIETRSSWRPTPDTLRKIAVGLATNRALGRVDPPAVEEVHGTLMRAAGYLPKEAPAQPVHASEDDLRATLMAMGFRPHQAPVVNQILAAMLRPGRTDRQRDQILNAVATMMSIDEDQDEPV